MISPEDVVQLNVKVVSWERGFTIAETETLSPAAIERFVAFISRIGQLKQSHEIILLTIFTVSALVAGNFILPVLLFRLLPSDFREMKDRPRLRRGRRRGVPGA